MRTRPGFVFVALLVAASSRAQQPNAPRAGYVYPAGGQQGTTVDVIVGGRFLEGANGVIASGRGVRGEVIGYDRPLNGQQITELREKLQELQKQGNRAAAAREIADARRRIGDSLRRNANPALAETVTVRMTISPDAPPGSRQVALLTPQGVTNPLVFCVGQLTESREKDEKASKADAEMRIPLPAIVNGRIVPGDVDRLQFPLRQAQQYMPGDVDRYRFAARKGQNLVIVAAARDLMPYLADAVPGWFQATLALYDANGREVAYDDDYRFQPDPVIHYEVPGDGEYVVEIRDALYRGREDFVYRIAIGELPFITSIYPLGGRLGAKMRVTVTGWNLPAKTATVGEGGGGALRLRSGQASSAPTITTVSVRRGALVSNSVPFALDSLPEVTEREPNDAPKQAQRVNLPVIVNGRIERPGDEDVFRFSGRAGDEVVAEVCARRLASPLDSVLDLTDASGVRVAVNDDHDDRAAGLIAHQADSLLMARLPATGTYFLRVRDVEHKGGPEYGYRLRIGAPRPDFDLRVTPSHVAVAGGGTVALTVHAIRRDGFAGDIALALKDAPAGFRLSGGVVPGGQDHVRVTLTAPPGAAVGPVVVRVEGRAAIQAKTVVHEAAAADAMMQAFAYEHLVPADELRVSVIQRGSTRVASSIANPQPVKIPAGGGVRIRISMPPGFLRFDNVAFELSEPPDGIALREPTVAATGAPGGEFVLQADAGKAKVGLRGNVIVTVSGERPVAAGQQGAAPRRRVEIATLPAIAFEIVK